MSATHTIFESYSRPQSLDFSDNMLAFPSYGTVIARIKAAIGNWAQAAIEEQTDAGLWEAPSADTRVQAETARAAGRLTQEAAKPLSQLAVASDRKPLSEGWGKIIEQGYQTRFHTNGAQHA